jgi:CubicO group peptidase (beta-lactamase class C family)
MLKTIIKLSIIAWNILFLFICSSAYANQNDFDENELRSSLIPAVAFPNSLSEFSLKERMQHYGASAVSIAIVRNNELIFQKGFGTLSKSNSKSINQNTIFQAASLSKAITSLGVMRLVAQDKISLDNPVNSYLKGWQLPRSSPVTVRELLSHTAGVNNASYSDFEQNEMLPNLMEILNGDVKSKADSIRVEHPVGKFKYSGGGYMVLQKLMEDVSGSPYTEYMGVELFEKFGAKQSHFQRLSLSEKQNIAVGHGYSKEEYPNGWFIYPQEAAAGLWSTPSDLARILIAYMKAYQGIDTKLFPSKVAKDVAVAVDANMGLGFGSHGEGVDLHVDHAGWTKGYRAYMTAFPERGDAVVVMANSNHSNRLIEEIVRNISNQLGWNAYKPKDMSLAKWSEEKVGDLVGAYKMQPAGFIVTISKKDNYIEMKTPRGTIHQLYPVTDNKLVMIEDGTVVKILNNNELYFWGMKAKKQQK